MTKKQKMTAELIQLCRAYGEAHAKLAMAHRFAPKKRLDDFDPRFVRWENRVFNAERALDLTRAALLTAARKWHAPKKRKAR